MPSRNGITFFAISAQTLCSILLLKNLKGDSDCGSPRRFGAFLPKRNADRFSASMSRQELKPLVRSGGISVKGELIIGMDLYMRWGCLRPFFASRAGAWGKARTERMGGWSPRVRGSCAGLRRLRRRKGQGIAAPAVPSSGRNSARPGRDFARVPGKMPRA